MTEQTALRSGIAKKLLHFLASVAIALVVGKAIQVFEGGNIEHLKVLHDEAVASVRAFEPTRLAESYICNLKKAGLNATDCSPVQERVEGLNPYAAPPPAPSGGAGVLTPIVAAFAVVSQLVNQPTIGSIFALLQFAAGLVMMLWLNWGEKKQAIYYYLWLPLGTVFLACVAGWLMQGLLLGGLAPFGWFTGLAGICCGSGAFGFLGYEFFLKAVEVTTDEAAQDALNRR